MSDGKIRIQLVKPERHYVKVYNDFLYSTTLTAAEKMMYIVMKSFVAYGQDEGELYPSVETFCKITSMTKPTVIKTINSLVKKGVVKKERRGLSKTNVYLLYDNVSMWAADSVEEMAKLAESGIDASTQEILEELQRRGVQVEIKKEPTSETGESTEVSTSNETNDINNVNTANCQERYSLLDIKNFFDYDVLIHDGKCSQQDIDAVMNILYDVMNTQKKTIRVSGESKPSTVVIGKLMKLSYEEIAYSIRKYNVQTEKISNPKAYMLSILYSAKEQMNLEINNKIQYSRERGN